MACRSWSKLCCGQKWLLLLSPLFLLFLMVSVMTLTLPLPLPGADMDWRSSRALSSAGGFRSRPRVMEAPPSAIFQQPLTHIHSGSWRPEHPAAPSGKNSLKERSHADLTRNKHRNKGIASKRKETAGAIQHPTRHHSPRLPQFTVNSAGTKTRIKPSNHSAVVKLSAQTYTHLQRSKSSAAPHRLIDVRRDRSVLTLIPEHYRPAAKHSGKSDKVGKEQQAVKKVSRDMKKHQNLSEDPSEERKSSGPLDRRKARSRPKIRTEGGGWCRSFRDLDFPKGDHRRLRTGPGLPWFSEDDVQKMELLAEGEVLSKARVPAHGQVIQVALDPPAHQQKQGSPQHGPDGHRRPVAHSEWCQRGHCSLIKRTDDWFEVLAFHLDRVLGLNRSLPAVLRTFHSDILPYRYTSGTPRPVVWWDPDIQHLADGDNDQNSVPLSWAQYQQLLQVRCGSRADLRSAPCVGVHHSEWGRLALFDFLLQVYDRLDRYCCGFRPDPTELCVENLLHAKCGSTKDLLLVHILVRKADPSRLVFIDNAGRPEQSTDNLNLRLIEGIDQFPERAVSLLQSGCLPSLLLRSLYTDREFWDSQGGAGGLRPLISIVEHRGKVLLQHIRDQRLQLNRDL